MSKWTRDMPTLPGWHWVAVRFKRERKYRVKPVEVWDSGGGPSDEGLFVTGLPLGGSPMPFYMISNPHRDCYFDLLWMSMDKPTPPVYSKNNRKPF